MSATGKDKKENKKKENNHQENKKKIEGVNVNVRNIK